MKMINGLQIRRTLEDVCDPRHLALLIYDMQVGIVNQLKDGAAVAAKVREVLTTARATGLRTFFTRHLSLPKELMGAFQYRMAMAWQRTDDPSKVEPWFLRDSPGFAIVADLAPLPSEAIFDKLAMSAFEGTPLNFALRDCGISAIAIAGIASLSNMASLGNGARSGTMAKPGESRRNHGSTWLGSSVRCQAIAIRY